MKKILLLILSVLLTSFIFIPSTVFANDKNVLRFGVLSYRDQNSTKTQWHPTMEYLEKSIPQYKFELVPLYFADLDRALSTGGLDFILTNPEHFVLHRSKLGLSAIATLMPITNGHPTSEFGGVILTRADNKSVNTLADLKDKLIASPSKESFAGYLTQAWLLAKNSIDIEDLKIIYTGMPHDKVVNIVLSGKADAGFIRTGVLESMIAEKKLTNNDIKIINQQPIKTFDLMCSTELYPEWPLVANKKVPTDIIKKVSQALLNIQPNSSMAVAGNYFGFAPPKDYTGIEAIMQRLRIHPDLDNDFDLEDVFAKYTTAMLLITLLVLLTGSIFVIKVIRDNKLIAKSSKEKEMLLSSIEEGLYGVDLQGRCTFINRAALEILECTEADIIGLNQHQIFHHHHEDGEIYEQHDCPIHKTCQDGQIRRCDEVFFKKNGTPVPVQLASSPIYENDKIIGAMVSFQNVTAKKAQEKLIQQQKDFFELISESIQDGIFVLDAKHNFIYANKAMNNISGVTNKDLLNQNLITDFQKKSNGELLHFYNRAIQTLEPTFFEIFTKTPNGKDSWMKGWIVPKKDSQGRYDGSICIVSDFTEENQAKLKLAEMAKKISESEERLNFALDGARDGVWDWDITTNKVFYSKGWKKGIGFEEHEIGDDLSEWKSRVHPDDLEGAFRDITAHFEGKVALYSNEHRIQKKDGTYKWILDRGVIVARDDHGNPTRMVGSHTDISDRKAMEQELKELNETLEQKVHSKTVILLEQERLLAQQSKLATMGEMISNIAHQWRQPLNSLAIKVQYIPMALEFDELTEEFANNFAAESMSYIEYMSQTIDDFRNFFKPDKEKADFCVKDAVNRAFALAKDSLQSAYINIEIDLPDYDMTIFGYPNEFSQVVLNILNNAKDALVEKRNENRKIDVKLFLDNKKMHIKISDNAGGIPEEILNKIFEPYFTTKHQSQGTGLGLYMSKLIIEQNMSGKLNVSNNTEGACFDIEIG